MSEAISKNRLKIFYALTLALPVLFFVLVETGLRLFDYNNLDLFVPVPQKIGNEPYLMTNGNIAKRYFPDNSFTPLPPLEAFKQNKPENGFRIFVMGGSTTAGWPYPNNVLFSRILAQRLSDAFPDRYIEVINTGVAAINSFTLLDFTDEIIAQKPDAVLIYAGHNEFYGALGGGSTQSIGQSRWLIKTYLSLLKLKIVQLIRNIINASHLALYGEPDEETGHPTLMGQMIDDQSIALGSDKYRVTKSNFEANLSEILSKLKQANIPVMTSELVSNLSDHPPFISVNKEGQLPADLVYQRGKQLEGQKMYSMAREAYTLAKDLDGLRFRASEEFNESIHKMSAQFNAPVVPMKSYFEKASPNGIIGSELMLEHLHPNTDGYILMSEAFFDAMKQHQFISDNWDEAKLKPAQFYRLAWPITDFDRALGAIRIINLTDHYPFKPKAADARSIANFTPRSQAEALAFKVFKDELSFTNGHLQMAEYLEGQNRPDLALREFQALLSADPYDVNYHLQAANYLIMHRQFDEALPLLYGSLNLLENEYAYRWIGQILLLKRQPEQARPALEKALSFAPKNIQNLFNLGVASAELGNLDAARQSLKLIEQIDPENKHANNLKKIIADLAGRQKNSGGN